MLSYDQAVWLVTFFQSAPGGHEQVEGAIDTYAVPSGSGVSEVNGHGAPAAYDDALMQAQWNE